MHIQHAHRTPSHPLWPSAQTEHDDSIMQQAIYLLSYAMCDHTNAQTIVEELLHYL
jgi:hypothetical protein